MRILKQIPITFFIELPLNRLILIDSISEQHFITPAMSSMMTRYATESKNGLYGVYVGQEEHGNVH